MQLPRIVTMLFRPRATMRRILDTPERRLVIPLLLLALCSSFVSELHTEGLREGLGGADAWLKLAIVAGVLLGVTVVLLLMFWAFSWLVFLIARLVGGAADVAAVRAALAWGLVPQIWALIYRLPAVFVKPAKGPSLSLDVDDRVISFVPGAAANGCALAAGLAIAELVVLIWCIVVMSLALAEASRFSGAKGLGALALAASAPLVIVAAAVLAIAL